MANNMFSPGYSFPSMFPANNNPSSTFSAGYSYPNMTQGNQAPAAKAPSLSQGLKSIGSMVSQGMQVQAPPQAQTQTQTPTGFYYNNVPVSEADYRRLTATPTPVPQQTQAPASVANAGGGPLADFILRQAQAQKAEADRLRGQIQDRTNPYGTNTEGYQRGLNAAQNTLVGQQNRNQALAAGRIGGLASGLRGAQNQAMQNDARAAFANVEAQMYGAERDRATAFENDRDRALMQLANGDFSGAAGLYSNMLNANLSQFNADRGYGIDMDRLDLARKADARDEVSSSITNEANRLQIETARATLPAIIAKANAGAQLTEEEARQAKWANDNAGLLAGLGFASSLLGAAGQAAATYYGVKR